jgi:phosphoribosylformylglycinamidine synthase
MAGGLGFTVSGDDAFRRDAFWFGEAQSRVVVSVSPEMRQAFEDKLQGDGTPFSLLGKVEGDRISVDEELVGTVVEFREAYDTAIEDILGG